MYYLSRRSLDRLAGVHGDLIRIVSRAIQLTEVDFFVHEGLRTEARQRMLVKRGTSKTMRSKHLTGHAVDLWTIPLDWSVVAPGWTEIARAMKTAASDLAVDDLSWGLDLWGWDCPHWEICKR